MALIHEIDSYLDRANTEDVSIHESIILMKKCKEILEGMSNQLLEAAKIMNQDKQIIDTLRNSLRSALQVLKEVREVME